MKLLEITRSYDPSVGGLEKSIHDKTKIYDALGIDCQILSTDYYSTLSGKLRDPDAIYVKQYTPYNITPGIHRYFEEDYDVVNVNMIGRYFSDAAIRHYAKTRTKIILTPHSFYHTRRYDAIKKYIEHRIFPGLVKKAHALVVFTEHDKQEWCSRYGIDREKVFVIPHFIDLSATSAVGTQPEQKEKESFLYLGRAGANKLTDLFLRAFCSMKDLDYSLAMTINESDIADDIKMIVKKDARIKLMGYISEERKITLLRNAGAIVFPTSFESFGYSAFEASWHGKPLLCSDIPVFRELLSNDGTIYFKNDQKSLMEALSIFRNLRSAEKQAMGKANKKHLINFSFDESVRKYKNLFNSLSI